MNRDFICNQGSRARRVLIGTLLGAAVLMSACVHGPGYYGPPPHYHYYPHPHDYYFYPSARVYFHFTTGYYYYLDGTVWIKTRVLPTHIRIDATDRVRIRVDSAMPYTRYREHVRVHRPRPDYRPQVEPNRREREANRRWAEEYQRKAPTKRKSRQGPD